VKWIVGFLIAVIALGALAFARGGPRLLDVIDQWTPGPGGTRVVTAQAFGAHGQKLDIWSDGDAKNKPVLVFFYGGGWVKGTREEYGWAARAFVSKGFVVVVPDYRKVPEVVYPAFVEDAADAVRWTHDNIAGYGGDPERIAIAGHSAGGYAVAMLALDRRWLGKDSSIVKAAVGLSGPYDFYPFTGRAVAALGTWPKPAETQPLTYARADAPPMLLVTGNADTTVRPKNARNLFRKLRDLGAPVALKEYAGLGHEDVAMALSLPFRSKAPVLDDSAAFLTKALNDPALNDRP
jgi:acetyl esterase/lipase